MTATTYVMPKRQWEKPAAAPHPAPEVPCRPATGEEVPRGARTVRALATRHGWTVRVTYARGTRVGRTVKVINTIALRLQRVDPDAAACCCRRLVRAWAVWADGKFDQAQVWYPGGVPLTVNATALREHLSRPAGVEAA